MLEKKRRDEARLYSLPQITKCVVASKVFKKKVGDRESKPNGKIVLQTELYTPKCKINLLSSIIVFGDKAFYREKVGRGQRRRNSKRFTQ